MSQVQTRDFFGNTLPLINFTVSHSSNPDDPYIEDFFTDYAGNSSWPHQGIPTDNVYLHVNHYSKNQKYVEETRQINSTDTIVFNLARAPLTRIKPYAYQFNIGHLRINTDFRLYNRWLDGENINSQLFQRMTCGSGGVRTLGMTSQESFGHRFYPGDYGDSYFNQIDAFAKVLQSYGLYWYFTAFADTGIVMPDQNKQLDHYNRLIPVLEKYDNIFFELVNEYDQHSNFIDKTKFTKPANITSCSGSCGVRNTPKAPHWDFIDYHPRRDYPGCITEINTADYNDGTYNREQIGKPIGTGEPVKFGTGYETDIRKAFECGQSGIGVSPLNCFHAQQGTQSEVWDDTTMSCAKAFFGR